MGIKYVGTVADNVHGRQKRQNITRWMYVPKPKYKPNLYDALGVVILVIAIGITIVFFATLLG